MWKKWLFLRIYVAEMGISSAEMAINVTENNGIKSKVEKNRFSYSLSWARSRSRSMMDS